MENRWTIEITETDDYIEAIITREGQPQPLGINVRRDLYPDRNEAIGELFSGSLPNIRDSFDTI